MAKTQSIDVADELKNLEAAALERSDRFVYGVVQAHKRLPSKKQKRLLARPAVLGSPQVGRGSLFRLFAPLWRELSTAQKDVWKDAGGVSGLTNWQTFVSDNAARVRNSLALSVPPSELWQVRAGRLLIESPASEIILKQEHPLDYWTAPKIVGKSWKRELVRLTETFSLPLSLSIRYKSNLSATGPEQVARYFARIWYSYQGTDRTVDVVCDFSASSDWVELTASLSGITGIIIGYTLFLEVSGYTGELLFDNIEATHGGTNWARDPRCDDISKTFVKGFAVVPPFWVPVSLPTGASFSTEFPPSL
jgi:hypothetical protein